MRIGLDARCLNTAHVRGMGKYVYEVVSRLGDQAHEWLFFGDRPEERMVYPPESRAELVVFETRGHRFHAWEQWSLPRVAAARKVDLLHCTGSTVPYMQPVKTVVTVHDTLPWDERSSGFERAYLSMVARAITKCAAVITISEASKRDILKLWPTVADRLHVIPHGVGDAYLSDNARTALSPTTMSFLSRGRYLLYLGGIQDRKRFPWAVDVLAACSDSSIRMLACGFTATEASEAASRLPDGLRPRVDFLPFVSESEMPMVYERAIATLYPTLYEGFGFPAVESQAVGTPVLFSTLGSLAELVGPHSVVLPPHDLAAWVRAVNDLADARQAPQKEPASAAWAKRFSWDESARRHDSVYQACARPGHSG
jgi:glycosyltransferase involved in cell wall biosynthesis